MSLDPEALPTVCSPAGRCVTADLRTCRGKQAEPKAEEGEGVWHWSEQHSDTTSLPPPAWAVMSVRDLGTFELVTMGMAQGCVSEQQNPVKSFVKSN